MLRCLPCALTSGLLGQTPVGLCGWCPPDICTLSVRKNGCDGPASGSVLCFLRRAHNACSQVHAELASAPAGRLLSVVPQRPSAVAAVLECISVPALPGMSTPNRCQAREAKLADPPDLSSPILEGRISTRSQCPARRGRSGPRPCLIPYLLHFRRHLTRMPPRSVCLAHRRPLCRASLHRAPPDGAAEPPTLQRWTRRSRRRTDWGPRRGWNFSACRLFFLLNVRQAGGRVWYEHAFPLRLKIFMNLLFLA